jgi:hypothetical protein
VFPKSDAVAQEATREIKIITARRCDDGVSLNVLAVNSFSEDKLPCAKPLELGGIAGIVLCKGLELVNKYPQARN